MTLSSRTRSVVAGAVLAAGLILPVTLTATPASASPSAFCSTVFNFKHYPTAPKGITIANYHTWAKMVIPFYEKLQSTAPNAASKKVLGEIVTILKYYSTSSSFANLSAYEATHRAQWIAGTTALAKAIESCAKSLG